MLSFTALLYIFDCPLLTAGLHLQQFWSIEHQSHHFLRCRGIGDGGQSIETCWSYMSNPVQLCFHNSMPDKYLRSQNQCHKKGAAFKRVRTVNGPLLRPVQHSPFSKEEPPFWSLWKTKKKPQFFQDNQPRPRKTKQKKTTAPFRVSSKNVAFCSAPFAHVLPGLPTPLVNRSMDPRRGVGNCRLGDDQQFVKSNPGRWQWWQGTVLHRWTSKVATWIVFFFV